MGHVRVATPVDEVGDRPQDRIGKEWGRQLSRCPLRDLEHGAVLRFT